jgi:hypothetical protein
MIVDAIAFAVCVAIVCHGQKTGAAFVLALAYILLKSL